MDPQRLLRSSAFRLALGYVALFGVSAAVLLAFVYGLSAAYMERQADETIEAEIEGLAERYRLTGLAGLTTAIQGRLDRRPAGSSIYLLTDALGNPIVGNLNRFPDAAPDEKGFIELELTAEKGERAHRARAKIFLLRGGFRLLVGRDLEDLQAARSLLLGTIGWGVGVIVALALLGGLLVSRSRIRRIGSIDEVIGEVMAGNLSRRIPRELTSDDIEDLVEKLNGMLDELEKLVEGVRRVSDAIAHDLRTPLARLKTRLERLRRSRVDPEIDEAIEEADRLLGTFAALLRIARIEAGGGGGAALRPIDLTALIDDVANLYAPHIEERGTKLVVHNAAGVVVEGDRDMLFQAVANLLDNSLQHTEPPGTIEIALVARGAAAEIVVADRGPGIPFEERDNVRERFYRLDRSRSTPGAGLGLSLVSAIAALHRGELRLEDNQPGLRAVMRLPLAVAR